MLHRAPVKGRRREHLCGSHCLSAETTWGAPARSWQVPSESVGVGVSAKSRGREQLPPLGYADCGRWWPAQPRVQPNNPVPFSAPAGRAGGRDTRRWSPGHRPGFGSTRRPGCSSTARVRCGASLGPGGVAAGVRGVLGSWLPAAVPGRLCAAVQPAVGGLSTAESGGLTPWWASESVPRSAYTESHWLTLQVGCAV